MLETEQNKVASLRKELQAAQSAADSLSVLNTLVDLPGVSPESLIEIMSGKIQAAQSELNTAKTIANQAQSEVMKLKRTVAVLTQSQAERSPPLVTGRSRSESPTMRNRRMGDTEDSGSSIPADFKSKYVQALSGTGRGGGVGGGEGAFKEKGVEGKERSWVHRGSSIPGDKTGTRTSDTLYPNETGVAGGGGGDGLGDMTALSLVVDGETTPQVLLDALNAATMAQSMRSQAALIASLRSQLEDSHEGILHAESNRLRDVDELEGRNRIEIESAHRRLELLQAALDDCKEELTRTEDRCAELERDITMKQTDAFNPPQTGSGGISSDFIFSLERMTSTNDANMSSIQQSAAMAEDDRAELDRTKSLLRERTAQLKILMETLDSLQQAGVKPGKGSGISAPQVQDPYKYGEESLFGLAASPLRSDVEERYAFKALVKRVVELTAELTSESASCAMEGRRATLLEREGTAKSREIHSTRQLLKGSEETQGALRLHLVSLTAQVKEAEKRRAEEISALRIENVSLVNSLRESEAETSALMVTIDELSQQIKLTEEVDIRQWLESIISRDTSVCDTHVDSTMFNTNHSAGTVKSLRPTANIQVRRARDVAGLGSVGGGGGGSGSGPGSVCVRDLVMGLLSRWGESAGAGSFIEPPNARTVGGSTGGLGGGKTLTKAEQRFYQSVCDLTMAADERANRALLEARAAEVQRVKAELSLKVTQDRLRGTVEHLQRYRKRSYACEQSARISRKLSAVKESKLSLLLNKTLSEQRSKVNTLTNTLLAERKSRQISETNKTLETLQLRRLQLRIADLEARGGATLRGRDEALAAVEDRIKEVEEGFHKWIQVELPRLLSGMPVDEESSAYYNIPQTSTQYSSYSAYSGKNLGPGSGTGGYSEGKDNHPYGNTGSRSAVPSERSYALEQSLCVCKAAQSAQELRISTLLEKNYILKERCMEMQGVLTRWGGDIEATTAQLALTSGDTAGSTTQSSPHTDMGGDSTLLILELQKRMTDIESDNVELKGRLSQAMSQVEEQTNLVDILTGEEDALQGEATREVSRVRMKLEKEHFEELKALMVSSEEERKSLEVSVVAYNTVTVY